MISIKYNNYTRSFSIQGETGIQLRRLKEFLDNASEGDSTPKIPVFYQKLDRIKKSKLEYKLNNELNTKDLKLMDYMPSILYTRKYDVDNGTKILDNGFLIIMHGEVDGNDVGALLNMKDRKGVDVYTYKVKKGETLNHKEFTKSEIKNFTDLEFLKQITKFIDHADLAWIKSNERDLPILIRMNTSQSANIDDHDIDNEVLEDKIISSGDKVTDDEDYEYYRIGNYYFRIPNDDNDNGIVVYK